MRLLTAPHAFDLVVMDCQMPEMDGLEAPRRVRSYEAGSDTRIPIIALAANAIVGDRDVRLDAGMDNFMSNRFD